VTIGCANLRTKQGHGDDYIPVMLTSSNSGWHKGGSTCGTTQACASVVHRVLHCEIAEELG
jgi:hypothetical protein